MVKTRLALWAVAALAGSACTVNSTAIPDLAGPSELALSFQITAAPDSIRHDGVSSSSIVVTARDPQGKGISGMAIRLDILPSDYGTLSNQTVVTGSDGTARATYTSPPPQPLNSPIGTCSDSGVTLLGYCVGIAATPIGSTSYGHLPSETTQIHLIPPGIILPPADPTAPTASFVYSPLAPKKATQIAFNASASRAIPGRTIVQYNWSWGDGEGASRPGPLEDHDYPNAGLYPVVLTVVDDAGISGSSIQVINVLP